MNHPTSENEWITVKDVQQMLSLGSTKVRELLAQEQDIATVRIGSAIRVNKASLERWLDERCYQRW